MTVAAILPFNVDLFLRPTKERFLYALVNTSLCFFLFSFQVHEKSILLPLLSVTVLLPRHRVVFGSLILVATMSMLPLLQKDGLVVPCIALCAAFAMLLSILPHPVDPKPSHPLVMVISVVGSLHSGFGFLVVGVLFWRVVCVCMLAFAVCTCMCVCVCCVHVYNYRERECVCVCVCLSVLMDVLLLRLGVDVRDGWCVTAVPRVLGCTSTASPRSLSTALLAVRLWFIHSGSALLWLGAVHQSSPAR
jgi:ALG6, ALG8 glycosyltransferase family